MEPLYRHSGLKRRAATDETEAAMLRSLKLLFAKQADPYAGADLSLTLRLGGLFWIVNCALAIALWPFSPIDRQIGHLGWLIGDVLVIAALVFALALRSKRFQPGFTGVLVSCYLGALGIAGMQWLAGGETAPYDGLLLNLVLLVSATNPLRRVAGFIGYVAVLLAAPLAYGGWESATAAKILAEFVIWTPLAFLVFLMMSSIRGQRLSMRREEAHAREEARLDELTVIGNRRAFEEALVDEISRADRMETPLSMAMGDIEHFKRINDEFGHLEGDRCLNQVAQAMNTELRTPDRVFRWGGDEFVLLLPGTAKEDADVVIGRMQAKVSAACRRPNNEAIWIHFAAAQLQPQMTATELTEAADLALMAERAKTHRARV
jgi:diguanylate cyclase (GGDEF)-like protein